MTAKNRSIPRTLAVSTLVVAAALPAGARAQEPAAVRTPQALRIEHEELHEELTAATRAPGRVGEVARELAGVLHSHFEREQEIALPPLALLEPLARGEAVPNMEAVLPMTDSLRAELPQMLAEHEVIGDAARRLVVVAREEGDEAAAELGRKIQLHARTEEVVFYPAAILVGDLIRARLD